MKSTIASLFDLQNKVALVTGGAMGIGAGIADRLAEAGASVSIADVDGKAAERVARSISNAAGLARGFACDLRNALEGRRAVEETVRSFGRIDIVVNNAGVFPFAPAIDVSEATWDHVFDVNLKGAFFLAQAAAQAMIRQANGGSIINIASIDAFHPSGNLVHYDASKAAMVMMTRSLALELGRHHIRVNAIAPGAIKTPGAEAAMRAMAGGAGAATTTVSFDARIPLGRMGEPDDIARAVLFLASPAADYMTGSTMVVDGGFLVA